MLLEKRRVISTIAALVLMLVLTPTLFRSIFCVPVRESLTLQICATGEQNPDSWGSEVRVNGIQSNGGKISLREIAEGTDGWNLEGDVLISSGENGDSAVSVELQDCERLQVDFIGQRGSGMVEVQCNGTSEELDLYRDADWETIPWEWSAKRVFNPLLRLDLLLEMTLILWVVLDAGILYVGRR